MTEEDVKKIETLKPLANRGVLSACIEIMRIYLKEYVALRSVWTSGTTDMSQTVRSFNSRIRLVISHPSSNNDLLRKVLTTDEWSILQNLNQRDKTQILYRAEHDEASIRIYDLFFSPSPEDLILNFTDIRLNFAHLMVIAASLPASQVKSLILRGNNITLDVANALARVLPLSQLELLDIGRCGVDNLYAEIIARGIPNSRLKQLHLDGGFFDDTGAKMIARALRNCRSLEVLFLDSAFIDNTVFFEEDTVQDFRDALQTQYALHTLTGIEDEKVNIYLERNRRINAISIMMNSFESAMRAYVQRLIQGSPRDEIWAKTENEVSNHLLNDLKLFTDYFDQLEQDAKDYIKTLPSYPLFLEYRKLIPIFFSPNGINAIFSLLGMASFEFSILFGENANGLISKDNQQCTMDSRNELVKAFHETQQKINDLTEKPMVYLETLSSYDLFNLYENLIYIFSSDDKVVIDDAIECLYKIKTLGAPVHFYEEGLYCLYNFGMVVGFSVESDLDLDAKIDLCISLILIIELLSNVARIFPKIENIMEGLLGLGKVKTLEQAKSHPDYEDKIIPLLREKYQNLGITPPANTILAPAPSTVFSNKIS